MSRHRAGAGDGGPTWRGENSVSYSRRRESGPGPFRMPRTPRRSRAATISSASISAAATIEIARGHQIHRGKTHHLHIVWRINIMLGQIHQRQVAIQQARIVHRIDDLPVVVNQHVFVLAEVSAAAQPVPLPTSACPSRNSLSHRLASCFPCTDSQRC